MESSPALVVVCRLPLDLRPLPALPEGAELGRYAHAAVQVLQGELTADERRRAEPRSEEDSAVLQDLHRVEAKLDLLLDLFAEWRQREQGLPAAVDCHWSVTDLQWEASALPAAFSATSAAAGTVAAPGSHPVLVQVYPGPRSMRPLQLPGQLSVERHPSAVHCRLVYADLGEHFADLLGRYLFRLHRREVAETRAASRR
jgi:hypothetical protein